MKLSTCQHHTIKLASSIQGRYLGNCWTERFVLPNSTYSRWYLIKQVAQVLFVLLFANQAITGSPVPAFPTTQVGIWSLPSRAHPAGTSNGQPFKEMARPILDRVRKEAGHRCATWFRCAPSDVLDWGRNLPPSLQASSRVD